MFWQDHRIPSSGIRPLVCYGVGREFGISSDPTKAIKSAILGRKMKIGFKGPTVFNFAQDIADIFIQCCVAVENIPNAYACNLSHCSSTVENFVECIQDLVPNSKDYISIDSQATKLPFPMKFSQDNLNLLLSKIPKTNLLHGIEETIKMYKQLKSENCLHSDDLL
jgi:nucleoside-diphosphate-sugar epimerase